MTFYLQDKRIIIRFSRQIRTTDRRAIVDCRSQNVTGFSSWISLTGVSIQPSSRLSIHPFHIMVLIIGLIIISSTENSQRWSAIMFNFQSLCRADPIDALSQISPILSTPSANANAISKKKKLLYYCIVLLVVVQPPYLLLLPISCGVRPKHIGTALNCCFLLQDFEV